jgi:alcohol dehydrogenase class IV
MITLLHPGKIAFGEGSFNQFIDDYLEKGLRKLFIITIPHAVSQIYQLLEKLSAHNVEVKLNDVIVGEPSFADFEKILADARSFGADSVVGIGGGSVLDVAKLVAAQLKSNQTTESITGIGNLKERRTYLACVPTTSGTGSEMSPNAIFLDENGNKIGVVSPYLVPDASYIDPCLTVSVPTFVTAITGIDALSHCLEAYTNKYAHPVIDTIALEGISLVFRYLKRACADGSDLEAREKIALGSMYGGMCLGPVNTAGVHALAYPLGADYHLAHGLSIALLLPAVMDFNLEAAAERHAAIAVTVGARPGGSAIATGRLGIELIRNLIRDCGIPASLKDAGVRFESIDQMATDAMKIQRLLKNNIREITQKDAANIYKAAFEKV